MSGIVSQVISTFQRRFPLNLYIERTLFTTSPPGPGESERYLTLGTWERRSTPWGGTKSRWSPGGRSSDDLAAGAGGGEARVLPTTDREAPTDAYHMAW